MKIDFDDQGTVLYQESFELIDFPVGPFPLCGRGESFHPFHKHSAIPGSIKDRYLAIGRQLAPESPKIMMLILFLRRFDDRINTEGSRVEFLDQALDCATFAGRV